MQRLFLVENIELLKGGLEIGQMVDARRHQRKDGLEVGVLLHHGVRVNQVSDAAGTYSKNRSIL